LKLNSDVIINILFAQNKLHSLKLVKTADKTYQAQRALTLIALINRVNNLKMTITNAT